MAIVINGTSGISGVDGSAGTPALQGTDTNTGMFFPAADTIAFAEGGTECGRFNSSGNLQTLGTISVGNATPSTSGAGITFPATQSASSDANTLDDYEEGTWTPSIGGTATYGTQSGNYTKIGNRVILSGRLNVSSRGTGSQSTISSLPFTSSNTTNNYGGSKAFFTSLAQTVVSLDPVVNANTTDIVFNTLTAGATASLNSQNVIQDGTIIEFTITYLV